MTWETVIGLETHVQLSTKTKLFSRASTAFGASPNTNVNLIDCGLPGVLPSVNKEAFYKAIRFGMAVGAQINQQGNRDVLISKYDNSFELSELIVSTFLSLLLSSFKISLLTLLKSSIFSFIIFS